jgi:hypothetical protein
VFCNRGSNGAAPDTSASAAALARSSHATTTFSSTPGRWRYGQQPPSGNTFFVDLRFNLFKVTAVNTVDGTAFVNFGIVCYWTDSRLIDWSKDKALPPELWGPHLMLLNARHDFQEVESSFDLVNRDTGRLKRGREFKGTVDINMDLRAFPFDMGSIELLFFIPLPTGYRSMERNIAVRVVPQVVRPIGCARSARRTARGNG